MLSFLIAELFHSSESPVRRPLGVGGGGGGGVGQDQQGCSLLQTSCSVGRGTFNFSLNCSKFYISF